MKLPPKLNISIAVADTSVQTAPFFKLTSPVRVIVRAVPLEEVQIAVPPIVVAPVTVKFRNMETAARESTVNVPATLMLPPLGEVIGPLLETSRFPINVVVHSEPAVNEAGLLYLSVEVEI